MNVVLTAPIPGVSTPSFPLGGAILTGLRMRFPPVLARMMPVDALPRHQRVNFPRAKTKYDARTFCNLQRERSAARVHFFCSTL
jgi:hypothetical protein